MVATCYSFLLPERMAPHHVDEDARRGQTRPFESCIHWSTVPVWRHRGGVWHTFVQVHIIALTAEDKDDKSGMVLNRLITWERHQLLWESDPRQPELSIAELGLQDSKPRTSPGVKVTAEEREKTQFSGLQPPRPTEAQPQGSDSSHRTVST